MSSLTEFKSARSLQTRTANATSVAWGLPGASDPGEARFWALKYGLSNNYSSVSTVVHKTKKRFRGLVFQANSNGIVDQVLFGPPAFATTAPLAIVSGPRVSLYQGITISRALRHGKRQNQQDEALSSRPDRQVGTGGNPALCAEYRSDGRLLAVGTDAGEVRVSDATSRATLCTFRGHGTVRTVSWLRNGKQVLSGGDDGVLRLWDMSRAAEGGASALTMEGHGDSIRCAVVWQPSRAASHSKAKGGESGQDNKANWKALAMSGSYDHTIRVWNIEDPDLGNDNEARCLAVLSHGAPVEALLMMPNEATKGASDGNEPSVHAPWLISAGGTKVKVWNPILGTCQCTINTQHSKTITGLVAMTRNEGISGGQNGGGHSQPRKVWRILTTGLDGLIRIYTWSGVAGELRHIHGVKLRDTSITSIAFNETYDRLAIGTAKGHVLVRQLEDREEKTKRKRTRDPPAGTFAFFTRGTNVVAHPGHYVVKEDRKKKLKSHDVALREFRYGDALDEALESQNPKRVLAVLEELGKRRGLRIALDNRDADGVTTIVKFLNRYLTRPQFSSILIGVANLLIDLYEESYMRGKSKALTKEVKKLQERVTQEIQEQKKLMKIMGLIDGLTAKVAHDDAF